MKQKYEIMVIFSSQITDPEVNKHLQEIKNMLGSEVNYEEIWGLRPFAFKIKREDKGYYAIWNFLMTAAEIIDLENSLKHYPHLLRYLIQKVPENYKPISLAEIDAGIEKLLKGKADKRQGGGRRKAPVSYKKEESKAPVSLIEEKSKEQEVKREEVSASGGKEPSSAGKQESEKEKNEVPAEEPKAAEEPKEEKKKGKSLDEKLDDILSDADLGL